MGDAVGWGTKQSGRKSSLSQMLQEQLKLEPNLIENARSAAAVVISQRELSGRIKAAFVGYGLCQQDMLVLPAGLTERRTR